MAEEGNRRFQVIPAVDVVGDEAVRLRQGDFAQVVARAGDPAGLVARYAAARPPLVHVVDLDGARAGRIRPGMVARLADEAAPTPVQASGGIRSLGDARALLEAGAARVVVGTAALAGRRALEELAAGLAEALVVAVDARAGKVAAAGWERETAVTPEDFAAACTEAGRARAPFTAIERPGAPPRPP